MSMLSVHKQRRAIARGLVQSAVVGILSAVFLLYGCATDDGFDDGSNIDYREEMRQFVIGIAARARVADSTFIVIPQNGNELITVDGEAEGALASDYVAAIDGVGREDLFYGYDDDNRATPAEDREYMLGFLDRAEAAGVEAIVTDYCTTPSRVDDSYQRNEAHGYISFAADRDLANIPTYPAAPWNAHSGEVTNLAEARNFLYVLDPWGFASRQAYLEALGGSDHDMLIVDAYAPDAAGEDATILSPAELASLREKSGGGARLVVAYMSIGEAEDYRPYWDESWERDEPEWLAGENRDWRGNYKVRYWMDSWQSVILGDGGAAARTQPPDPDSYLGLILAAGFDGVYLDIIDAFEYFE